MTKVVISTDIRKFINTINICVKYVNLFGRIEKCSYICGVKKYTKKESSRLSQAMRIQQLLTLKLTIMNCGPGGA